MKEPRYIVFKTAEYEKHLTDNMRLRLDRMTRRIAKGRVAEGKKDYNDYLVINYDEPWIEEILAAMRKNGVDI